MSTSPAHSLSRCEPAPDVFDQLLQSKRLLTTQELAAILNLKPKTIYRYAELDLIPHFKIESNVRFRGKEVAGWLRQRGFCEIDSTRISEGSSISPFHRTRSRSHRASF